MSHFRDFPDMPPVWALGTALAQAAVSWLAPLARFDADGLGGVLIAAGLALAVWAAIWFQRKRTSIVPRDDPDALIVEGPFRLNRNPIYTGMVLVLLGWGLLLGGLSALALPVVFAWIVTRRFIEGEEAALVAAFGDAGRAYIASSRRW